MNNKVNFFRVIFNVSGRGHDRYGGIIKADDVVTAFILAKDSFSLPENSITLDKYYAFYIAPCDEDGHLLWYSGKKFHGWNNNGKQSYPTI